MGIKCNNPLTKIEKLPKLWKVRYFARFLIFIKILFLGGQCAFKFKNIVLALFLIFIDLLVPLIFDENKDQQLNTYIEKRLRFLWMKNGWSMLCLLIHKINYFFLLLDIIGYKSWKKPSKVFRRLQNSKKSKSPKNTYRSNYWNRSLLLDQMTGHQFPS